MNLNAWACWTIVLCTLICAVWNLGGKLINGWMKERFHARFYQPQQAHHPPRDVIDIEPRPYLEAISTTDRRTA